MRTFTWDVQYFCPLQCVYCYSNSGPSRRQSTSDELWRVAHAIGREKPDAVMFSGGEPALIKGIEKIAAHLREQGIALSLFTSGWGLTEERIRSLAAVFPRIHVSIDASSPATNDQIRGKPGAHKHAMNTLQLLSVVQKQIPTLRFGIECTILKSNLAGVGELCRVVGEIEGINFINVSPAVPTGRGSDPALSLLLDEDEVNSLLNEAQAIRRLTPQRVVLGIHRNEFLKTDDERHVQLNANGDVRAIKICEPTVGNIVNEPLESILSRAAGWRSTTPDAQRLPAVANFVAWGDLVRSIDREAKTEGQRSSREVADDAGND